MAENVIPIEWRRRHLVAGKALLGAERAALADLGASVARVTRGYARTARGAGARAAIPAASRELEAALAADLLRARGIARRAANDTLLGEFDLAMRQGIARGLPALAIAPELVGPGDDDRRRATDAAMSFAADWEAAAVDALAAGAPAPLQTATARMAPRVELQAATETSQAFSAERIESTTRFARRPEARAWAPLLIKVWDATLDRRRCPICADMSGQVRPWGVDFSGGRIPGGVHPRCRCNAVTMLIPLTWRRELDQIDEAA